MWRGQGHVTPIFGALNANCYTTVKDTDFIFDMHVPWDEKLLRGHVRTVPTSQGTRLLNLKSVFYSLAVLEQLAFNAQKFTGVT